jgi:hypothetical protein
MGYSACRVLKKNYFLVQETTGQLRRPGSQQIAQKPWDQPCQEIQPTNSGKLCKETRSFSKTAKPVLGKAIPAKTKRQQPSPQASLDFL